MERRNLAFVLTGISSFWEKRYKGTARSRKESSCFTLPEFSKHIILSIVVYFQFDVIRMMTHLVSDTIHIKTYWGLYLDLKILNRLWVAKIEQRLNSKCFCSLYKSKPSRLIIENSSQFSVNRGNTNSSNYLSMLSTVEGESVAWVSETLGISAHMKKHLVYRCRTMDKWLRSVFFSIYPPNTVGLSGH